MKRVNPSIDSAQEQLQETARYRTGFWTEIFWSWKPDESSTLRTYTNWSLSSIKSMEIQSTHPHKGFQDFAEPAEKGHGVTSVDANSWPGYLTLPVCFQGTLNGPGDKI